VTDRTVSVGLQLKLAQWQTDWRKAGATANRELNDLQKKTLKHKQSLDDISKGLAGVGVAAGIGFGLAVKKFADFDKAMSNVKAATHETTGNMQLLRDAALEAGSRTAFSATEAAAAIENLAKAGVSTRDILNGGLNGALDLAAAGGLDVAQAAETAATAMTQFKLTGQDVPHIADLLAAAAGKAQGEVSDMAAALNQSGLVAAQMGLSIEETTGTLAAFASAGLLGSDAGTSFKTMLLRLANPADGAATAMEELGIHAYDAQGAFIGIAPLAEQLQSKLKGLTQEQRDSALATIFGSDAIRAANVLYSNGAKGIAEWTTKVNDAGFAAETAAIKQDNLRGDLEKLGGAFETALIKLGEGGDGGLRSLTQGVTGLVDEFSDLPPAAQQAALGIAAVTAATALSGAGALKVVTAVAGMREAFQNLGRAGKGLTLSLGAVGIALTAAVAIYGHFSSRNEEAERRADELAETLDKQTGAITKNTRAWVAQELQNSGALDLAKNLGLNLSTVTDAALGNADALTLLNGQLDRFTKAGVNAYDPNRSGISLKSAGEAAQLREQIGGLSGSLTDAQSKTRDLAAATTENKSAQQIQAEAVAAANQQLRQQKQSLDDVIEAMHRASGAALTLSGSQIAYQQAIDDASQSAKEHGRTLDITTEKGRQNRAALNDIAEAANDQTDALLRSGKGYGSAKSNAESARKTFIQVATQMTGNKKTAEALARELIDIPKNVNTNVKNNADAAKSKATDYRKNGLEKLPKSKNTSVGVTGIPTAKQRLSEFARSANRSLDSIRDEAIRVNLGFTSSLGQNPANARMNRATGGPVFGAGSATSDSIPAMLSNGEHVWTAKEVQAAGGHGAVEKMRRSMLGFATGGAVGVRLNAATPTAAQIQSVTDGVARSFAATIDRAHASGGLGFARSQAGKPYVWGGVGPGGYDCSGFMSAITNVILGRSPYSRLFATGSFPTKMFAPGFGNFSIGSRRGNPGHMAGTLNGVNVESRGGDGVVIGPSARGAGNSLFGGNVYHLKGFARGGAVQSVRMGDPPFDLIDPKGRAFDSADLLQALDRGMLLRDRGGPIPTGTSLVMNKTGLPEWVITAAQRRSIDDLVKAIPKLSAAIEKTVDRIGKAVDKVQSLVQARNDFAASTTSSFSSNPFESGGGAEDLKSRLDARRNDARGFQQSLATLRKKGLNKGLWSQLAQSSNYEAARQLAQMTPAQLRSISQSYTSSQSAVRSLGLYAGNTMYGGQISAASKQLAMEQAIQRALQKTLVAGVKIVNRGGSAYLQSVNNS
jgi:TP901 family phage tail tape measure protein